MLQSYHMWLTAFTSIRVYAIDGQQWMKASVVMILGLVPVTLNIVNIFLTVDIMSLIHAWFTVWKL